MAAKFCSACGAKVAEGINFCNKCGAKIKKTEILGEAKAAETPKVQEKWSCTSCGKNDNTGNFCRGCGESKPEKDLSMGWICTSCGKTGNTKMFCTKCGSAKDNVSQENVSPIVVNQNQKDQLNSEIKQENKQGGISSRQYKTYGILGGIVVCAITIIIFLCTSFLDGGYEKQGKEYIKVANDIKSTFVQLENISGDANDEAHKKLVDQLEVDKNKLAEICDELAKDQTQEKSKVLLNIVKNNKDSVDALISLMNTEIHLGDNKQANEWKDYEQLVDNVLKPYQALDMKLSDGTELEIDNKKINSLIAANDIKAAIDKYTDNKEKSDGEYIKNKLDECRKQQEQMNIELKQMKEVVFLPQNAFRKDDNTFAIEGLFFNGTTDNVTSVKNMLVDIALMKDGKEVFAAKDIPYSNGVLMNVYLQPGANTSMISIEIPVDMKMISFDEYKIKVHKIHWSIRKIIRNRGF